MKTTATLLNEIDFSSSKETVLENLPILADKINDIFRLIQKCETIEEAEYYFALLERIQILLSELKFNRKIEIWGSLGEFLRRFERIDTEIMQKIIFDQIQKNELPLVDKKNLI